MGERKSGPKSGNEEPSENAPSAFSHAAFEENYRRVTAIGEGRRWYDYPYRAIGRISRSRLRRVLPRRLQNQLPYLRNFFVAFNEHDRHKSWSLDDRLHNLTVPFQEHVDVPGLWVVELFPPSQLASLEKVIKASNWTGQGDGSVTSKATGSILIAPARAVAGGGGLWLTSLMSTARS